MANSLYFAYQKEEKTCCPLYFNGSCMYVYSVRFRNKIFAAQSNSSHLARWL